MEERASVAGRVVMHDFWMAPHFNRIEWYGMAIFMAVVFPIVRRWIFGP